MSDNLIKFLNQLNINYQENKLGKEITYVKTGGNIKFLIRPNSKEQFIEIIRYFIKNKLNFYLLGKTTNTLMDDNKIYNYIIQTNFLKNFTITETEIEVESGLSMPKLAHIALARNIKGFELIEGIPGSVGGGIFMNASSGYGTVRCAISDNLVSVKYIDKNGEIVTKKKEELNFTFRKSIFHDEPGFIISAKFKYSKGEREEIFKRMRSFKKVRLKILEYNKPNLGSNFCTYDIYDEIAKNNYFYGIIYKLFRILRLYKFFSNKTLNLFTKFYFGWQNDLPYSEKTLNSFKKYPHNSSDDLKKYIKTIQKITKDKLRLEIRLI